MCIYDGLSGVGCRDGCWIEVVEFLLFGCYDDYFGVVDGSED